MGANHLPFPDSACAPKVRFASDSPLEGTGFEPSVPLLRKALLGVANRRRRHERRFRSETAMLAWSGCPQPFPSRRDREFESVFLQRRVAVLGGTARSRSSSTTTGSGSEDMP